MPSFPTVAVQTESIKQARKRIFVELFGNNKSRKELLRCKCRFCQIYNDELQNLMSSIDSLLLESWTELQKHLTLEVKNLTLKHHQRAFSAQWVVQESHDGQRRPAIVWLHNRKYVYKPRSLGIDLAWNALILWFENALGSKVSQPLNIISRNNYGLCEFVSHTDCSDESGINRYYWRLGAIASLLWAIGGVDATASNIVAAGEFPTLIDAETVLVPSQTIFSSDIFDEFRGGGIAPIKTVNLYGEEITIGAASLERVRCIHQFNGSKKENNCLWCHNIPYIGDCSYSVDGREHFLEAGFSAGLKAITLRKKELLNGLTPLELFRKATGRFVLRSTAIYGAVRKWLFGWIVKGHIIPQIEGFLRSLSSKFQMSHQTAIKVINVESKALLLGDIPRFELGLSRIILLNGVEGLYKFRYSAFDRAQRRLATLNQAKCIKITNAWNSYVCRYKRSI